ncbi:MAG: hypothetical protein FJ134_14365 [Deltaproteobacteria bacterium]|nr:hypothetical protein [Deltaproteobacteria bacterium]
MLRCLVSGGAALILALALMAPLAHGGDATHMGQIASKHVLLSGIYDLETENLKFYRVHYDTRLETKNYRVPPKEVLVITDVTWTFAGSSADAGRTAVVSLSIYRPGKKNYAETFLSSATLDATGWCLKNEKVVSGVIVGADMEVRLTPPSPALTSDIPQTIFLRGYLAPRK